MQKTQVHCAGFSLLLSQPSASSLVCIVGLTLLLCAANAYAGDVSLAWDAVSTSNLGGYRLYYGQTSRTYTSHIDVGLQTTATVTGLTAGQTYFFAATAYDLSDNESTFSNEVSTTITASATAPVAAFSASTTSGQAPLTVAFIDMSTGSITAWAWDFGDGSGSTLQSPTHIYSTVGIYTVQLTVTGSGGSSTATKIGFITVTVPPPVANFIATPTTGPAPLLVTFIDASAGSISTWTWSFGDGTSSMAQNPQHIYSTAGIYTVSLTIMGPGGSATKIGFITVNVTVPPPVAAFSATPTTGPAPLLVTFTDASTGSLTAWAWSFGDGITSTTRSPQHIYSTTGTYTVSLTVSGPGGTTTAATVITVQTNPAGLVAAYSFDEGIGPTATDVSGAGNHGTLTGATWTTAGKFGGALSFNGTSSWVTVHDAPSLDLTTGLTLEAWVYPTKVTAWDTVIMKEQPDGFVYTLYASTANKRPGLSINVSTSARGVYGIVPSGSSMLPPNTWSHLAGTYDGITLCLYVNGTLVTRQLFAGRISSSTGALSIGGDSIRGDYFQGRLDEVRLYNRALSASEIQDDMRTPINVLNSLSLLP